MELATRRKASSLIEDLIENNVKYDFFQALHLLELTLPASSEKNAQIHLFPAADISFPVTEIKYCTLDKQQRICMQLTFKGLYGVDSPLPYYFIEQALKDDNEGKLLRKFLNIFNQRLYMLFYQAWQKYHIYAQPHKAKFSFSHILLALSGTLEQTYEDHYLQTVSLHANHILNTTNLEIIISTFLKGIPVAINSFIQQWIELDSLSKLSSADEQSLQLGNNIVLGKYALDRSTKIEIHIGPVISENALELMSTRKLHVALNKFLQQLLHPFISYDVFLSIATPQRICLSLGQDQIVLGWLSWLGNLAKPEYGIKLVTLL